MDLKIGVRISALFSQNVGLLSLKNADCWIGTFYCPTKYMVESAAINEMEFIVNYAQELSRVHGSKFVDSGFARSHCLMYKVSNSIGAAFMGSGSKGTVFMDSRCHVTHMTDCSDEESSSQ